MPCVAAADRHQVTDSVGMQHLILDNLTLNLLLQAAVDELQD
jgi:hypothetical protein